MELFPRFRGRASDAGCAQRLCREVMMRYVVFALGLALVCTAQLAAQEKKTSTPAKPNNKMITLSGCVVRGENAPSHYTLEDKEAGTNYRLTGTDVRDFIGQRVQIIGGVPSRRLTIVG